VLVACLLRQLLLQLLLLLLVRVLPVSCRKVCA
jgi:hypothetical protein